MAITYMFSIKKILANFMIFSSVTVGAAITKKSKYISNYANILVFYDKKSQLFSFIAFLF